MREGLQYYHRYLSAFHLERFDLVARDTARNLRLFAFVVKHAARQRDRIEFDRYRPYVEMMHCRAQGLRGPAPGGLSAPRSNTSTAASRPSAVPRRLRAGGTRGRVRRAPVPPPMAEGPRTRAPDRTARAAGTAARGLGEARELRGSGADPRPDPPASSRRVTRASAPRLPLISACRHAAACSVQSPHRVCVCPLDRRAPRGYSEARLVHPDEPLPCSIRGGPFGEPTLNP